MLFRAETLEGIKRGDVTVAFRRWKRPNVKAAGRVRTAAGVVRIGAVETCQAADLDERDAAASGFGSLAALLAMLGPEDGNQVYRIAIEGMEADERVALRQRAEPTDGEWQKIRDSFARWDRKAPGYFAAILKLIDRMPGTQAATLAAELDREKLKFKQDVRKLKELGLTESLEIGYRVSPRGKAVLRWLDDG